MEKTEFTQARKKTELLYMLEMMVLCQDLVQVKMRKFSPF